ncbi:hypothetical protein EMIHUDRAFT_61619 [Emiliania huxleyi CCMP1516]|uniref:Major facilitator superfamily (MFS) profile domain-containing protein n=2 Tax=Emiliania huxleyi TaxID=2903 RepID=A0A0D3J4P7_EMIH1|nr:hypothetical protein EMIHUDRAFT_61619 [Emiliania huxleyi CCMP1516]EOD18482.1 hypothetical protein EMIHUDRAFT_61619 [Emiliania huxleyi CCMP1516]|eukprot:XP_005770911.1 hypothetical protein EMIHUDRAFT_61619 [Emiliania huxleyi CCMP1516]
MRESLVLLIASAAALRTPLPPLGYVPAALSASAPPRTQSLLLRSAARATALTAAAAAEIKPQLPPPEDVPSARVTVLLLCCAIGAVCALDRVLISIAILPMAEQFAYSDSTKGAIAAGFSLGYCLGLLPAGVLASSGSPRQVLLGGLVVWSAATCATPLAAASSVPALLATRAVMGVGEAAAVPTLQAVAARFVQPERRSLFWGCLTASLSCGTIAAYVLAPPLIAEQGWPFVFEAFGAAGLSIAVLWAVLGADAPRELDSRIGDAGAGGGDSAGGGDGGMGEVPWRALASSRPVWAMTAAHCSSNFFMYFGLSWLPTYFSYQFGLSTADASTAALYPFAAGAVGSLAAGAACDALVSSLHFRRTDARKVMQSVALGGPALAMLALCLLSAGAGGLQLERDEAEALFVVAVGCQAGSAAGYGCGAQDISTRLSSLIYGGTSVFAVIAGASGQYFTGWLLEQNGRDFTPMFALVVAVELAGLVAWNRWWDSERVFE